MPKPGSPQWPPPCWRSAPAVRANPPDPVKFGVTVEAGNLQAVQAWLDAGLDPQFLADRIGTGLMIAAWEGNIPMMALFVSYGARINATNNVAETALMHAAWKGHVDAAKWLLDRRARINGTRAGMVGAALRRVRRPRGRRAAAYRARRGRQRALHQRLVDPDDGRARGAGRAREGAPRRRRRSARHQRSRRGRIRLGDAPRATRTSRKRSARPSASPPRRDRRRASVRRCARTRCRAGSTS